MTSIGMKIQYVLWELFSFETHFFCHYLSRHRHKAFNHFIEIVLLIDVGFAVLARAEGEPVKQEQTFGG